VSDEDEIESRVAGADGAARRDDIIARLYAALDRKMREIETRIERASHDDGEAMSAADCERDARTLTTLAKLYEKICELEGSPDAKTNDGRASKKEKEIDADRFRHQVAERLQRMLEAEED
jgi:hypothetical protein